MVVVGFHRDGGLLRRGGSMDEEHWECEIYNPEEDQEMEGRRGGRRGEKEREREKPVGR